MATLKLENGKNVSSLNKEKPLIGVASLSPGRGPKGSDTSSMLSCSEALSVCLSARSQAEDKSKNMMQKALVLSTQRRGGQSVMGL